METRGQERPAVSQAFGADRFRRTKVARTRAKARLAAGQDADLIKLREWLEERGIHFPRGGKHPSMMRLWLEKAGVFTSGWRVSEARLRELIGTATAEFDALASL